MAKILTAARGDSDLRFSTVGRRCLFRMVLGTGFDAREMMARLGCCIAVLGGEPEPIPSDMLPEAVEALAAGRTVLLLANWRELRGVVRRDLMAMAGPARGALS
jgi:hypothetical protein